MSTEPFVGVVGVGYVGLTTAVCVAAAGRKTVAVDINPDRVGRLRAGVAVIDLLGRVLRRGAAVALKSTVPVGTTSAMAQRLCHKGIRVVSTPEFLREGRAIDDFRNPDRLVIGNHDELAAQPVHQAYGLAGHRVLRMSPESAELAKYASNAFLAVKLSYTNSLAALCARVGADRRIGAEFLRPGPVWGGSCLPKDTAALLDIAHRHRVSFAEVEAARQTNTAQARRIVTALRRTLGRPLSGCRITALGLTFKAATSDTGSRRRWRHAANWPRPAPRWPATTRSCPTSTPPSCSKTG